MTNTELLAKIKAEVERLKNANAKLGHTNSIERYEECAYGNACDTILSILSGFEKEEKSIEGGGLVTLEYSNRCFLNGVEKGRNDMYKQMMKEAVESTVENGIFLSNMDCARMGYKLGDKVRIIIVKED